MLARLTGLAIALLGYFTLAGYMAIDNYLTTLGIESSIATFGNNGLVHYGLIVVGTLLSHIVWLVIGFLLLLYVRAVVDALEAPYHTIEIPKDGKLGYLAFLAAGIGTEQNRVRARRILDIFQTVLLVGFLVLGIVDGNVVGARMVQTVTTGGATVGNSDLKVTQRVRLNLLPGAPLPPAIAAANRAGRLNVLWEDSTALVVSAVAKPIKSLINPDVYSVQRGEIAGVEHLRTYLDRSPKAPPDPPPWILTLANTALCLLLLAVAVVTILLQRKAYRQDKLLRGLIRAITPDDISLVDLPRLLAEQACDAIAWGKDLRITRWDGSVRSTVVLRNAAFARGIASTSGRIDEAPTDFGKPMTK